MSHKTITAVTTIDRSQLKDDVEQALLDNGLTTKDLAAYLKQQEYRKQYAQREHVKQARKQYRQERYQRMKQVAALLSGK